MLKYSPKSKNDLLFAFTNSLISQTYVYYKGNLYDICESMPFQNRTKQSKKQTDAYSLKVSLKDAAYNLRNIFELLL